MPKKKKKVKKSINKTKLKYILKLFIITIIVTLLLEFCYVIFKSIHESVSTIAKEFNERIVLTQEGYIIVGSSNFKYSTLQSKSGKYEKPRMAIYDDNDHLQMEIKYKSGYNGLFMDGLENEDGYLAVGFYQRTSREYKKEETEGLIVKYDKNGNINWERKYKNLTNTKYNKVITVQDGYIVVGSSTYASIETGKEKAGALLLKYDKNGKMIWKEYYGDNKTGSFNDVIETSDGYIVVGSKDASTGIVAQYNKNGLFQWKKEYENIGNNGLSRVKRQGNNLIFIGSFKQSEYVQNRTNTALLVLANLEGKMIKYTQYGQEKNISQWNDLVIYKNNIYVVGVSSYINEKLSKEKITHYNNKAIYAQYDMNLKLIENKEEDKNKTYQYTSIMNKKNKLYITGYTNAKCDLEHADGKNYVSFVTRLPLK